MQSSWPSPCIAARSRRWSSLAALVFLLPVLLVAGADARAEPWALVGILQGSAVVVRQSNRFALAEGAALNEGDLVETPAGSYVQIELADGSIVGVAEASRLALKPRLAGSKTAASPRLYLLEGWLKVRLAAKSESPFVLVSPQAEIQAKDGALVVRVAPKAYAVFVESGSAQLLQRDPPRTSVALKPADFAAPLPGGDRPAVATRIAPDFLQQLPRPFRDPLPARAELFARRSIVLQPLGPVAYADVAAWLHTEPALRLPLSRQWRGRAADPSFRTEVAANLGAHMEWEPVIFPERFLPKKAPEPPRLSASAAAGGG
jgi:hypothetical protein